MIVGSERIEECTCTALDDWLCGADCAKARASRHKLNEAFMSKDQADVIKMVQEIDKRLTAVEDRLGIVDCTDMDEAIARLEAEAKPK